MIARDPTVMLVGGYNAGTDHTGIEFEALRMGSSTGSVVIDCADLMADAGIAASGVLYQSSQELARTRHTIHRDERPFYNYYSLPSPVGRIAPVIDILCPAGRLPALNQGHLEPAISINLGPGHIHGHWAEELSDDSWRLLHANCGDEPWIVGDSYFEPSFCPHTYSLATKTPARILSYTIASHLQMLFYKSNHWNDRSFCLLKYRVANTHFVSSVLRNQMEIHGQSVESLARLSGVKSQEILKLLDGESTSLALSEIVLLAGFLGMDYRTLLPGKRQGDELGNVHCSVEESKATIRSYRSYKVASMACSSSHPDLSGLFVRIGGTGTHDLDLVFATASHHLVSAGELEVHFLNVHGCRERQRLSRDDTLWVGTSVEHAFTGFGFVLKMSNPDGLNYLDLIEANTTHRFDKVLARGRLDLQSWTVDGNAYVARRTASLPRQRPG